MLKRFLSIISILTIFISTSSRADEGMWLPMLIKRLNQTDMQKMGLQLTAEEIYSVNNSSMKDAIVNFGNFCTGEVISKEGLVLTNHHCGFDAVQSHSSVEHDYLTEGFWAMTREEEKPNPGLTVTFLVRMEDVTSKVLNILTPGMTPEAREDSIESVISRIEKETKGDTHYTVEIKSFFEGNEYYLFVYEVFQDVRLVGAPPSSVGKFGGDTDNWMWPRHTGDFSIFRIYTAPDGKPAPYAKENIPYKPKHHLPVSLKGVEKNDFAMVMGYPGGTDRYMSSEAVSMALEQSNPTRIKLREKRLALMKEDMDASPDIRIKYASKYATISNYYKYFIGQNQGLRRLKVVGRKKEEEQKFQQWVDAEPERKGMYGNVLKDFETIHKDYRKVNKPYIYLEEGAFGTEILLMVYQSNSYFNALKAFPAGPKLDSATAVMKAKAAEYFKDYNPSTDQKVFAALLAMYYNDVPKPLHPTIFATVEKKYKGDFNKYAADVFAKSIFASKEKMNAFLAKPSAKVWEKDPAYLAYKSILGDFRSTIGPFFGNVRARLDKANNLYLQGILEMRQGQKLYPDANFTMRLTYGSVQDCVPGDAIYYNYYTTMEGIMQKEDSTNEEFIVPKKLKELYYKKDFGRYADKKGYMPVCFITNNDITGGNSGSPVINGKGQLIGTAFDGNWEAMSGDIIFEPKLQRCISVDIRYILFMIDKYAGAGHLVNEMTLVE
ncbi:MAG TPA: S46 family peptidase [Cytophagaceae bacterium]|nr:S46 family peptidase [Cytophagaceae bacterium]